MATVLIMMILCVVSTMVGTKAIPAQQVQLRGLQVSPPGNTSMSASEYEGLVGLLNDTTQLTSLYRTSVHGTNYSDLLDRVGDAKPLVFVIKKDKYVIGVYISEGIQEPANRTDWNYYHSGVWWFSLAGHFPQPTKMDLPPDDQLMLVAGREGQLDFSGRTVRIGDELRLGNNNPLEGIRVCQQSTRSDYLPEGYTGERDEDGNAVLGGSLEFMADEIEVLQVPYPTASEYEALVGLLGMGNDTTQLTSLYRASVNGTTYGDLLDNVGDAKPLVFVVRKDEYVFGVYISAGIQEPDNQTSYHQTTVMCGGSHWPATSPNRPRSRYFESGRNCLQYTLSFYKPEGYTGERDEDGNAVLGGSLEFMADEIEVLEVPYPTASEYEALVGLLGMGNDTTQLTSLYRTSVQGTNYSDLLDNVGDAKPLIFVIRKDQYVFGVYISADIQEPDDLTTWRKYDSDVWWFSLAGHFTTPTKIEIPEYRQWVEVAGREEDEVRGNMYIGGGIILGAGPTVNDPPAADIRSCNQSLFDMPEGYMGRDEEGYPVLGGSLKFMADEIEVLQAAPFISSAAQMGVCLSVCLWLSLFLFLM
ncbi:unnamed protein product [Vitrella brassicaformis CCMP3155]|uniref:Oxidation resistance protein 1 n=1 Tax=Vitrella brassicaformis (strain CCMP3155) TaxID=1169540 RepID=A0A0G4GCP3_VITBC|nr:unnamed protein product [Vitrella brassicaformis CCMP3155]|eukprot:CEM27079.1 unnamed protein product [Vitrella brassicaformis CCMP3155]